MTFKGTPKNPYSKRVEKTAERKAVSLAKRALYFFIGSIFALSVYTTYEFIQTHDFKSPVIFQNPFPRKLEVIETPIGSRSAGLIQKVEAKTPEEMTDEEYIRYKFGKDGNIAVAVAKAESGLRADAVNPNNSNGTIDIGCWQVNSVHLKKRTITISDLLDCKKATDWVYEELYQHQGFRPWVAYNSQAYKSNL